jgi:hypothetical protein
MDRKLRGGQDTDHVESDHMIARMPIHVLI